jgi:hypothetical protein
MCHGICVIPIRYLYHIRYMCHSSIHVIDGNKGLINGRSCMATIAVQKQQSRTLNKVFIEIITMPTRSMHMLFMKPYMTNAIFRNKNLMMFSDHI